MIDPVQVVIALLTAAPVFLFALVFHEYCHALAAWRLGDRLAAWTGRLTLDPRVHMDPVGTILMPVAGLIVGLLGPGFALIFGWAKPVPFNPTDLKNPIRDTMLIALAGPLANLALLAAFALTLRGLVAMGVSADGPASMLLEMAAFGVFINGLLAMFNMLPLPPLDGSKVLAFFLPPNARRILLDLNPAFSLVLILVLVFNGALIYPLELALRVGQWLAGVPLNPLLQALFSQPM